MINKFKLPIFKNYYYTPDKGRYNSVKININANDKQKIKETPELILLEDIGRITCHEYELWYFEDDEETINILKKYLELD
jgi:hypothetical protein